MCILKMHLEEGSSYSGPSFDLMLKIGSFLYAFVTPNLTF